MQPFIAITASEILRSGEEWAPIVYGQSHTYSDAIVRAGAVPFIVPLIDDQTVLRRLYDQCQGLILSGGDDIDPDLYQGIRNLAQENLAKRDSMELSLLKWALSDDKPVLGICRGMQFINVALGGSLHRDIGLNLPGANNHEQSVDRKDIKHLVHNLTIVSGSKLSTILGDESISTNSLHHQAVKDLGQGVTVSAYAEDGVIEVIELTSKRFVIGVQSHPESLEISEPNWSKLFKAFVEASLDFKR